MAEETKKVANIVENLIDKAEKALFQINNENTKKQTEIESEQVKITLENEKKIALEKRIKELNEKKQQLHRERYVFSE